MYGKKEGSRMWLLGIARHKWGVGGIDLSCLIINSQNHQTYIPYMLYYRYTN